MQKITNIINIICSALIGVMSLVPDADRILNITKDGSFLRSLLTFLDENRLKIGIALALFIFIVSLINELRKPKWSDKFTRKWCREMMRYIIDSDLGGVTYETRITIFRVQNGFSFFLKYIFVYPFKYFKSIVTNDGLITYFKKTPFNFYSNYLTIYERYSNPKQSKSFTYFRRSSDKEPANSVVDECCKKGRPIIASTHFIDDIKIPDKENELKGNEKSKISKYMNDTFIKDYSTLKMLNHKANEMLAIPLTIDVKVWGVLIIDKTENNNDKKESLQDELNGFIEKYQNIFSLTLSLIKK